MQWQLRRQRLIVYIAYNLFLEKSRNLILHNEMNFYASENTALCEKLGLGEMPETDDSEVDGSLTNFAWVWGYIFQEGIEIDQIENRKRIGGVQMNAEHKCSMQQIDIENLFQRCFRMARIGYQNVRTLLSVLF